MALFSDLLEQAGMLATREKMKPKQASLRRAVSTAYYALFHFLIEQACAFMVSGQSTERRLLRLQLARSFDHGQMKQASRSFLAGGRPWLAAVGSLPLGVRRVASAFVDLQEGRHDADYNMARSFTRDDALSAVHRARSAIAKWQEVRSDAAAEAYLVALLAKARR